MTPKTWDDLSEMLPDAALELVGERQEVVIYTGWTVDEHDNLVPMEDD